MPVGGDRDAGPAGEGGALGPDAAVDHTDDHTGARVGGSAKLGPDAATGVEADATAIPDAFEISVEDAEVGFQVFAKDLALPNGATLLTDEDLLVVNVIHAPTAEEVEAELEEAEAEVGIERDESDEEAAEAAASEGSESEAAGEGDTVPETDANNGQS